MNNKTRKFLAICLGITIVSLFIVQKLFYSAFPEASIHFKVNKGQSVNLAETVLQSLSIDVKDYKHSVIFGHDNRAKTFLEKELGAKNANTIMGSRVRLWKWSNRWFKSLSKEEITVHISPEGELLGFVHALPEEAPGDSLAADSARTLAELFLTNTMNILQDSLEFIEHSQQTLPNRIDHTFIWKSKSFNIQESEYRYKLTIQGNEIGSYSEFLHIPDSWTRNYEKLRSKNDTTSYIASFLLFLTLLAMLVMLIKHTRNLDVKWKTALMFGLVAAVLTLLAQLNEIPLGRFYYDTTESYSSFILRHVLMDLIMALLAGAGIFFLTAAAEPLYRERYDNHLSLTRLFTWQGLRSRSFFIACIVGITLTFAFIAYQIVFYIIADKLGGWAPQDIPYSNMLNTAFPWVYVLLSGFIPAVSEEFISRMFSIPFFNKFIKSRWISVIIPAFIWGFAHANYAQEPFYIRGLEVGIAGIIIGFIMLRFGILATLIWHYSIDAVYTALVLLRSGNPYLIITASISCGILLIPLIISIIAYLKTGKFLPEHELTNTAEGFSRLAPIKEDKIIPVIRYTPLTRKRIITGFIVALLLASTFFIKTKRFGDFVAFPTDKLEVKHKADSLLLAQNVPVDSFKSVVYVTDRYDPLAAKYVLEHGNLERLDHLYSKEITAHRWAVRYFKPLQKKEYRVHLDPESLDLLAFSRQIDDDAPGENLDPDSALTIAKQYLLSQNLDTSRYSLVQDTAEKMKHRTDFRFEWESRDHDSLTIADMHIRVAVDLQGDNVSRYTIYPKIPEAWQRQREKQNTINTIHLGLRIALLLALVVMGILRFIKIVHVGEIFWKRSIFIAGFVAFLFMIDGFSQLNLAFKYYSTSIGLSMFHISTIITILLSTLLLFAGLAMMLSMISALYPGSLQLFSLANRHLLFKDALITAIITIAGYLGISHIHSLVIYHFPQFALINSLPLPSFIDAPVPFYSNLVLILYMSLFVAAISSVLVFIFSNIIRKPVRMSLFLIILVLSFTTLQVRSFHEAFFQIIFMLITTGWFVFIILRYARNNYLAYLLTPLIIFGSTFSYLLMKQNNFSLTIQGIITALILLFIVVLFRIVPQSLNKSV